VKYFVAGAPIAPIAVRVVSLLAKEFKFELSNLKQ
jgi:hypothetical protein